MYYAIIMSTPTKQLFAILVLSNKTSEIDKFRSSDMKGGFNMINKYNAKKTFEKEPVMFEASDACMPMYATAYVRFQQLNTLYNPMEGLERGTIFPELYFPYM